jgi:hypothetical protein
MPYSVVDDGTILRATFAGVVSGEDFHVFASEVQKIVESRSHWPNNLVDLRAVEIEPGRLSFNDLLSIAKMREAVKPPNPIRTALVAGSPAMMGFARMFQSVSLNPSITIEVFADVAAAERWLTAA